VGTISKADAALAQLDAAIAVAFWADHPLAVRTIVGAALGILSDLVELRTPGHSWRTYMIEDAGVPKAEALGILNRAQNFLKHANRDSTEILEFDELENDDLLFIATLEAGALDLPLSPRMQAYQLWYFAVHGDRYNIEASFMEAGRLAFPSILQCSRLEQLTRGAEFAFKARTLLGLRSEA
jgi:hypothetical protein